MARLLLGCGSYAGPSTGTGAGDRGKGAGVMKVQVVFYSMYGHVYRMAEAVAEGARGVDGVEVELLQVPELVPEDVLEESGAKAAHAAMVARHAILRQAYRASHQSTVSLAWTARAPRVPLRDKEDGVSR
jgi:flavorubredoxin